MQSRSSAGALSVLSSGVRSSSKLRRQLSAAVAEGDPQLLRHLLANDADASSFVAYPDLLHCACATGNLANVALLLRYGANVNTLAQTDRYRHYRVIITFSWQEGHASTDVAKNGKERKGKERKGKERKEVYLSSAIYSDTLKALRRGSHSFTCK